MKDKFPNANIILCCYYHFINRIKKHISKNFSGNKKNYQNLYDDLLCNMRLISFININQIHNFFLKVKDKYKLNFTKFFDYFEKNYLKKKQFNNMEWNCNYIINHYNNNIIIFFTNNIVESTNRTINVHYGGNVKSFLSFKNFIKELLDIFNKKKAYQENKLSVTRALAFYTNKIKDVNLINRITYKKVLSEI